MKLFLDYLRSRRTDDNQLEWPSTGDDETTTKDMDDPAKLVAT